MKSRTNYRLGRSSSHSFRAATFLSAEDDKWPPIRPISVVIPLLFPRFSALLAKKLIANVTVIPKAVGEFLVVRGVRYEEYSLRQ